MNFWAGLRGLLPEGREFLNSGDAVKDARWEYLGCEIGLQPLARKWFTSTLMLELYKSAFIYLQERKP